MTAAIKNNGGSQFDILIGGVVVATIDAAGIVVGAGRRLAQIQSSISGALATGTTTIPNDNTIPQNTEGDQYYSVSITPLNAASTLEIDVVLFFSASAVSAVAAALFRDSTASAIAAGSQTARQAGDSYSIHFKHVVSAGSTAATTFKVRAGGTSGTLTVNGSAGAGFYGGVIASGITVKEYLP